jgi:hypothetical protein
MSTEDINIRLTGKDEGATSALRRLRDQVVNNEKSLKSFGDQGKLTGQSLKDMSSVLGPEIQILGDRIDHITGALNDVNGASAIAKAGLAGLVAVGSFEVGRMMGDFIFKNEEWKKSHDEAVKGIASNLTFLNQQSQSRFDKEMEAIGLAATAEQQRAEAIKLENRIANQETEARIELIEREKELRAALANDLFGYGQEDNALAEQNVASAKERLKMLQDQRSAVEQLLEPTKSHTDLVIEQRKQEADTRAAQAAAAAAREQEQKALQQTQDNYLASLKDELVRLKEGEEAYTRLTLAKQGFEQSTIDSAIALRAEIDAIKKAEAEKNKNARPNNPSNPTSSSPIQAMFQAPGQVQGTQARFITRGTGSSVQDKILEATRKQIEQQRAMLEEQKKTARILEKVARDPM